MKEKSNVKDKLNRFFGGGSDEEEKNRLQPIWRQGLWMQSPGDL